MEVSLMAELAVGGPDRTRQSSEVARLGQWSDDPGRDHRSTFCK